MDFKSGGVRARWDALRGRVRRLFRPDLDAALDQQPVIEIDLTAVPESEKK
jgi:hypothetical protein